MSAESAGPISEVAPRVALVGPVAPFRGGIAQHTTMLHRAISERAQILTFSFSRQYPRWLFPGEADREPDGRPEARVRYALDSLNPMTWGRVVREIRAFAPAGVVLPWWTVYWAMCFHHLGASLARAGIPVTIVCHNPIEHEDAPWRRFLSTWTLSTAERFVVHDKAARSALLQRFPNARVFVHPHPTHTDFPEPRGELRRRARLELLFFGFVRPYKGLDVLLDALARIRDTDFRLTVAGEFWSGLQDIRARIRSHGLDERVELLPRYHTAQEAAELFARADVVILPYRSATGSAVIPLAYRYGKPVIASRVGGLPDVVAEGTTGFLVPAESPQELAAAIASLDASGAAAMRPAVAKLAASMTWDGFAQTVLGSFARP